MAEIQELAEPVEPAPLRISKNQNRGEAASSSERTEAFVRELTDLSHKYGIGITGSPVLFLLERDDFALAYDCDGQSKLIRA